MAFPRIASLKTAQAFRDRLAALDLALPFDESLQSAPASPLARPLEAGGLRAGNRWCILPMEGWDGTLDGRPSELTTRRWHHFGLSGAKLIWGGEAVAVREDGRANPNQLVIRDETVGDLAALRRPWSTHTASASAPTDDLLVGLQLTHSGRFSRPTLRRRRRRASRIAIPCSMRASASDDDRAVFTDDELDRLVGDFLVAARRAQAAGFAFVDIKHCHGYLGHELLSGVDAARQVRRVARRPHALSARGRRRHPRRGAGTWHRRPPVGVRHGALPQGRRTRSANRQSPTTGTGRRSASRGPPPPATSPMPTRC